MKTSTLLAIAVAAAFAAPVMAQTSSSPDRATTTPGAVTGSGVHGATNAPDRPANTPKSESVTPAPVVVTPAPSASSGATASGTFSSLDRNNDGYISRDEARDVSWNSRFSELDKDNDGRLSQSEFNAMSAATGATGAGGPPLTGGTNAADRKPNTPKSEAQR